MRKAPLVPCLLASWLAGTAIAASAPERHAHIGYVCPAGGQQGSTFEVKIGGQYVYGATAAHISGSGVTAQVIDAREPVDTKNGGKKKKQKQSVIDEIVTLKITIAPDADPEDREIRLVTTNGLSDALVFQIGRLTEARETEPNDKRPAASPLPQLPVLVNGQIMPGDVDMFTFSARKGQHLVIEAAVRALIPYLADAVPGWFQASLALYDAQGREVVAADHFRFNPDPILFYDVPADGEYWLAIRDSIYRGREDFVYRISIGELPFITSVFPPGAARGEKPVPVKLLGRNLPGDFISVVVTQAAPSILQISVTRDGLFSPRVPFAVGDLPEVFEDETLTRQGSGQRVALPVVVNGRIGTPGEKDTFSFEGRKGQSVCLEVRARRLGSPLDSSIILLTSRGDGLGESDDVKDKGEGLLTHQADSELTCKLPEDGIYTVKLSDTEGNGGNDYTYRLRIGPPAPDFALRAAPASLSVPRGGSAPVTLHAIRREGFTGEIRLSLDKPSASGCSLEGGIIPEGADKVRATVSASERTAAAMIFPRLHGTAVVDGRTVSRPVIPAEDLMQAFIYQHLVPFRELAMTITEPAAPFAVSPRLPPKGFLELPLGKEVSFQVTVTRRPGFDGPIRLQLVDPPKGITLRKAFIPAGRNSAFVTIRTESKADAKLKENLILSGIMPLDKDDAAPALKTNGPAGATSLGGTNAVVAGGGTDGKKPGDRRAAGGKGGKGPAKERVTVTLPAVPFRIVDNPEGKTADAGSERKN